MRKLVLALLVVLAVFTGAASAQRPATADELRPITAVLSDMRTAGATIPTPTVVVINDAEGRTILGTEPKDWYAAVWQNKLYLHDSATKRFDSQAHARAVGLILKDKSRSSRRKRTDACTYCNWFAASTHHELVHVARERLGLSDIPFEEGLAEAVMADRVRDWGKRALNYPWFDTSLSPEYRDFTTSVRNLSARETNTLWTSQAAIHWRFDRLSDLSEIPPIQEPPASVPPSDPAPGNDPVPDPVPPSPPSPPSASWSSWDWQLSNDALRLGRGVSVYDVDLEMTSASEVNQIHAEGAQAICYVSAGTYEDWRGDAAQLLPYAGVNVDGWPGERWLKLDDASLAGILPVMNARASSCKSKGFDGIEWDNMDSYTNGTGNTAAQQRKYNLALAGIGHANGLLTALKNDVDQVVELEPAFDFAINEQCHQYNECDVYDAFLDKGKPVLVAEYGRCYTPADPRLLVTRFTLNLDGSTREVCT